MVSSWITHVKNYAKKHKISYKEAMSKAKPSYKKGSKSKTMKGKEDFTGHKGNVSKSKGKDVKKDNPNRDYTKSGGSRKPDAKRKSKKMKTETVELDGTKIKIKEGGLHRSLKVPQDYTFKRSELNKLKKIQNGDSFEFHGKKIKMTPLVKRRIVLGMNLMKK